MSRSVRPCPGDRSAIAVRHEAANNRHGRREMSALPLLALRALRTRPHLTIKRACLPLLGIPPRNTVRSVPCGNLRKPYSVNCDFTQTGSQNIAICGNFGSQLTRNRAQTKAGLQRSLFVQTKCKDAPRRSTTQRSAVAGRSGRSGADQRAAEGGPRQSSLHPAALERPGNRLGSRLHDRR